MVCTRVASLASWSWLWSLWLSRWPSYGLILGSSCCLPILMFVFPHSQWSYGLARSRSVSDYQCSFVPVFSSVVQWMDSLLFKSVKINFLLMSPICCVVANGLGRSLNISTLLKSCAMLFNHCKSLSAFKVLVRMVLKAV